MSLANSTKIDIKDPVINHTAVGGTAAGSTAAGRVHCYWEFSLLRVAHRC